ncbi:MAG TPA: UDP-N-acetylglucosamine 1-carboxyvinyltransferase [Acidobacteriota bacterium]|nr:UDP-N-acetylglucosamine 1-carboxyvinyltransferase [Acidobacteriota bacterium]HNB71048.1 UDP-N-acetylglucosamine 1-carboxyvinyltransferase [Acidobacteriota bacterium]HNG91530.1 UDP-N-acetylglucosamine 1-carboxyvinyltransferase [Acidobacteriota bacterium]HNH81889.1 UDP-N-acetylglucosamine 1-carboxyvinyltransferase [Acidobacteriota bacterium]
MDKFRIIGKKPLEGRISVSGAKNAALPCMAAALLTSDAVTLHNLPYVRDIITMRRLIEDMGGLVLMPERGTLKIQADPIQFCEAPYELVKTMRASVLVLGPLVARFGHASVSLPGGCAIGQRPIDLHLTALTKMGATIELVNGNVVAHADKLVGAEIYFDQVTVTGTENLMMAGALASGRTILQNAASEPEVVDLAVLLNRMGARITGAGTPTVVIEGVERLRGAEHTIIPDRIEAGTLLAAAAITQGHLEITDCNPDHLTAVIDKFQEAGLRVNRLSDVALHASYAGPLKASNVTTLPFPAFPTDMQAQYLAVMTHAEGTSVITETIFENRFMHASEMMRMGAHITLRGNQAIVSGTGKLTGAGVQASDLRASASLVLAGLAADGETIVDRVYHIDRGYERIEEKLCSVGAQIERFRN